MRKLIHKIFGIPIYWYGFIRDRVPEDTWAVQFPDNMTSPMAREVDIVQGWVKMRTQLHYHSDSKHLIRTVNPRPLKEMDLSVGNKYLITCKSDLRKEVFELCRTWCLVEIR